MSPAADLEWAQRRDGRPLAPVAPGEIVAIIVVRNEADRLPFFLDYHRWLGVDRFIMVDNASSDETWRILGQQSDVSRLWTDWPFSGADGKYRWCRELIDLNGPEGWTLILDADELVACPAWRAGGLKRVCRDAEAEGANAVVANLVDMYPERIEAGHGPDMIGPWWQTAPWFDDGPYLKWSRPNLLPYQIYGGVRQRLFWPRYRMIPPWPRRLRKWTLGPPYLSKVVLLKPTGGAYFVNMHQVEGAVPSAGLLPLLHFKFHGDFAGRVSEAVAGGQYFKDSGEYRAYARLLDKTGTVDMKGRRSRRFTGMASLVAAGLCQIPQAWTASMPVREGLPDLDEIAAHSSSSPPGS